MSNGCEIVIWDVQHGHAAYVKSPNNRHIVIDLGIGSYENSIGTFSPLAHLTSHYGVRQLDYAIVTHPHKDHIEDIFNLEKLSPKVLCCPRHLTRTDIITDKTREADKPIFEKYLALDAHYCGNFSENDPDDPSNPDNFGGLTIQTFVPSSCATSNLNNHSVIAIISFAGCKIVFPGDNESCSYKELMNNHAFRTATKDSDILLAPHHGRESGYYTEFVDLVNPSLTVISDSSKIHTSAVDDYGRKSSGWKVHGRSGRPSEQKKTVSTYNDGHITIHLGYDSNDGRSYLSVTRR